MDTQQSKITTKTTTPGGKITSPAQKQTEPREPIIVKDETIEQKWPLVDAIIEQFFTLPRKQLINRILTRVGDNRAIPPNLGEYTKKKQAKVLEKWRPHLGEPADVEKGNN